MTSRAVGHKGPIIKLSGHTSMEISFPGMFGASDHKFECSRTIDGSETIAIVKTLSSLTRFFPFRNIPAAIPGKTFTRRRLLSLVSTAGWTATSHINVMVMDGHEGVNLYYFFPSLIHQRELR